ITQPGAALAGRGTPPGRRRPGSPKCARGIPLSHVTWAFAAGSKSLAARARVGESNRTDRQSRAVRLIAPTTGGTMRKTRTMLAGLAAGVATAATLVMPGSANAAASAPPPCPEKYVCFYTGSDYTGDM